MTERELFLGALDREGARERAAFLDTACAGLPELRERIEALLRSHRAAGDFLRVPALKQIARPDPSP